MTADHVVPADIVDLATQLVDRFAEGAAGQLGELAEFLRRPVAVRSVPSDRWTPQTVGVPERADRIVSARLDGARVTLINTGAVTVALGADEAVTVDGSNRLDLAVGDTLTIDTRTTIFAIAAGAGGELAIITEEFDG